MTGFYGPSSGSSMEIMNKVLNWTLWLERARGSELAFKRVERVGWGGVMDIPQVFTGEACLSIDSSDVMPTSSSFCLPS